MSLWSAIAADISTVTGTAFSIASEHAVGGGSINEAYRIQGVGQTYFVKLNSPGRLAMFEAEAEGLQEIAASNSIRVPAVICTGVAAGYSFIVLEYLSLDDGSRAAHAQLGRDLAAMHRQTRPQFGWQRDNTIGSTPQHNDWREDWPGFLREQRLGYQLELAAGNGCGRQLREQGAKMLAGLEGFFHDYTPQASLLHGDLWSGNYAVTTDDVPVIFDPAVYYGDREADLAMTELFGAFPAAFYEAYQAAWPLDPGYSTRKQLYNLYHILNHFNLFGGGYEGQALSMCERLLAQLP
ncbi:MAG: fructosamine kinase family protein [Granulosicoccaceae bacterium]|jgi:fructosamine-3-kinase